MSWKHEFTFRPFSQDAGVLRDVLFGNEYGLPDGFGRDDVVIDVGSHVGCFAVAALSRGAGKVVCYEPDPDNFRLLCKNLSRYDFPYGRVEVNQAAVSCSGGMMPFRRGGANTACGHLEDKAPGELASIRCVALDEVLGSFRRVRLLKLDCEGAEWDILMGSSLLPRCREIVAELHTAGREAGLTQLVLDRLGGLGFVGNAKPLQGHDNALLLRATRGG
jgi:FkbM family methyltransferase